MYCSKCGKKVLDSMTFCAFCGARIVIPDEDATAEKKIAAKVRSISQPMESVSEEPVATWKFEPLDLDDLEKEVPKIQRRMSSDEEQPQRHESYTVRTAQLHGHAPELRHDESRVKHSDTFVPLRATGTENLFMDDDDDDEDFEFEEREDDSFFTKHIRGIVALGLSAVVVLVLAVWLCTASGQQVLAGANLAWRADIYAQLGNQYFQSGNYTAASDYYQRALNRDDDNYVYAYSAGVCSYMAEDTEKAAEMAKLAVKLDADNADAYELLERIYPDAATRPWEVQSLLNARQQALREAQ